VSAKSKKGLGRGFDSLIPTDFFDESFDPTAKQDQKVSDLRDLLLDDVQTDPEQPRHHFEEGALAELTDSIAKHGVLQPIVVTPKNGSYLIVAGERRYRAAKRAGETTIPAIVRTMTDQHKLEVSLIENIQRRDLNPLETATAYLKLRDQFNLTLDQIGERVGGKSVSTISNTLRLLRLPEAVKQAMIEGKLSEGQARPLIGADETKIASVLEQLISEGWSARTIEHYIASTKNQSTRKSNTSNNYNPVAEKLTKRFSTPVKITSNDKGAGQIVITFKTLSELERLQKTLEQ